jgi:hypothetical protein
MSRLCECGELIVVPTSDDDAQCINCLLEGNEASINKLGSRTAPPPGGRTHREIGETDYIEDPDT